jgi:hypothetical protein
MSRSSHQPSDACGIESEMTFTWPLPPRPGAPSGHGKKVTIVPGLPDSFPK